MLRCSAVMMLVVCFALLLACDRPAGTNPTSTSTAPSRTKPGMVVGAILDERGQPMAIADSRVVVWVRGRHAPTGDHNALHPEIKPDGSYAIDMLPGRYRVDAAVDIDWQGHRYRLPLHPTQTSASEDADVTDGIVKDFELRLTGRRAGIVTESRSALDHYGCSLRLVFWQIGARSVLPRDTQVTITLTPQTNLIDGSPARTLTHTMTKAQWEQDVWFDIPLAKYTATASIRGPVGVEPARFVDSESRPAESAPVVFEPGDTDDYPTKPCTITIYDFRGAAD